MAGRTSILVESVKAMARAMMDSFNVCQKQFDIRKHKKGIERQTNLTHLRQRSDPHIQQRHGHHDQAQEAKTKLANIQLHSFAWDVSLEFRGM